MATRRGRRALISVPAWPRPVSRRAAAAGCRRASTGCGGSLVLGTAALLVFAIGRLLVGSSDGADSGSSNPGAVQAAATIDSVGDLERPDDPAAARAPRSRASPRPPKPTPTPLAAAERAVRRRRRRRDARGARPRSAAATSCSRSSFRTLRLAGVHLRRLGRDDHHEHHLRQRPDLVEPCSARRRSRRPTWSPRKDLATYVFVTWNGRRSDATCSHLTEWALPGLVPRPRRRPRRRARRRAVRARRPSARHRHHHRHPRPRAHQEAEEAEER